MKLGVYQVVDLEGHVEKGLYGTQACVTGKVNQFHDGTNWGEADVDTISVYLDLSGKFQEFTTRDLKALGFNGDWKNMQFSENEALIEAYKNKNGKTRTRLYREREERQYEKPSEDEMVALQQWWDTENPTAPSVTVPEDDGADD